MAEIGQYIGLNSVLVDKSQDMLMEVSNKEEHSKQYDPANFF